MSRAHDVLTSARQEVANEREAQLRWVERILARHTTGLPLTRLHTKCVVDQPLWTAPFVRALCVELEGQNRVHNLGGRWIRGPLPASDAPKEGPVELVEITQPVTGEPDLGAPYPSQTAMYAPPESARWESPPGVPEEPSSALPSCDEPSLRGGADARLTSVSAGVSEQPAGATAGNGALVEAGSSSPGPTGARQPESEDVPSSPVSLSCPPPQVPVPKVLEHAPVPTPGVGMEPEGDGSGAALRLLASQVRISRDLLSDACRGVEALQELLAKAQGASEQVESLRAKAEASGRRVLELEQRVAELEAEDRRMRQKLDALRGLLVGP